MKNKKGILTKEEENRYKELLEGEEQEKWESVGYYGKNPKKLSGKELESWEKARETVHPSSIRLPKELVGKLRQYAEDEGLTYHSLIRMLLTRSVREHEKLNKKERANAS